MPRGAAQSRGAPGATEAARPRVPSTVFGDAWLAGHLDFGARRVEGDRLVAPSGPSTTLLLTLDPALQARAEALLAKAEAPLGAIVVMAPDGRLLAATGRDTEHPGADPLALALEPWAPSASVFKIVTASALLDAGLEPEAKVCVHGGLRSVEAPNLVDDPSRDDLCEDLTYGLAKSQNAIIAKLAHRHLDQSALERAARAFGYGSTPSFVLPARFGDVVIPADPLERARTAAGFGPDQLSPLGAALIAATVATGGLRVTPRLVAAVLGEGGERPLPGVAPLRVLDPDTAEMVGEMMVATTTRGTAYKAFHEGGRAILGDVAVAGKTGSLSRTEPTYLNYSWFVGYAPADAPRFIVAVLLGNSADWRFKSHTLARLLFETALGK
jgi:cell division protein FtsI/penicillin-binding protein 2